MAGGKRRKRWVWISAVVIGLPLLAVVCARLFLDEHLRRTIERNVNKRLEGYSVRIPTLHFHPLDLSLSLLDTTVYQNEHPDPPIAQLPRLTASVHWRALLHGRVVSDFLLERPTLHINLKQAKAEVQSEVPLSRKGWQDVLEEIYPLKVNHFVVQDADITYRDEGPFKPLHLSKVNFRTSNIRNIQSRQRVYPSDIHLEGTVFEKGHLLVDGHADFLAKPHAGLEGSFTLENLELDYFQPIIRRYQISVRAGILSTDGRFEYSPWVKVADIARVAIRGVQIDYIHAPHTEAAERQVAKAVARSAKEISKRPDMLVRVNKIDIAKSRFGFVNKAADPAYRVFLDGADIQVENLSSQRADGTARGTVRGKFMGTGDTIVTLGFRPKATSPDFDMKLRIGGTDMVGMNDLLTAYGDFDVAAGSFSLYSEVSVREGTVDGYVKPLFKDMQVYDRERDRDKPFFKKVREAIIGGIAWILENRSRKEVATQFRISGKLTSPEASTWEVLGGLLQNAFFKAVLPGLEREARTAAGPRASSQGGRGGARSVRSADRQSGAPWEGE